MPDVLIRNFPAEDLALLDEQARRLGLSRAAHLRRELQQAARRTRRRVTLEDMRDLADAASDLADPEVMRDAWA